MNKRRVIKDDGRYFIFYAFEEPLPVLHPDQVKQDGEPQDSRVTPSGTDPAGKESPRSTSGTEAAPAGPEGVEGAVR